MKHTPGPWAKKDNGDSFHIIGANGDWIATVHGGIEEDEANAQLIAAAPMLAEALLNLLNSPDVSLDALEPETMKAVESAHHALAAAGVLH